MQTQFVIPAALVLACSATAVHAQDAACDRTAIEWVLPGNFPQALARAQKEQRIVVIKGISFGVDGAGARCATKGVW
jgi:hypothetical protein